ncbi:MAG: hypothetical protein HC808_18995 [Candidatus Competibacteraceae bacterium]|nr:hypothetical protein [Candidatus Competibacteraceae bacterium]
MTVFQFHIPLTLKNYSFLSIGKEHHYLDGVDEELVNKAFNSLQRVLKLKAPITLALSGTFIVLLREKKPSLLAQIKASLQTDQIILLGTTYHFSLASLYSPALL